MSGTLSVNVGDSSYDFAGNLCVSNTDGSFSVKTTQSIESFMGIDSLVLRELELDLDMVFPPDESETSYTMNLGGRVALGPVDLSGDLLLEGARMRVCRMKLEQALSLDDLLGVIFTEKIWSPGILDISIYDGSLYYAEENCTLERIAYQKGLHIKAWMSVYGFAFQISGDFQDDSVSVSGNADQPIHLGFLTIAGSESQAGPGISFRTDADSRVLGLTGAIELFGERLLDIKMLGYDFKNRYFSGSVSYNGSVELFHGTISFIWDEKKGIQITEFPMQFIDEMLDYAKLLEEASKSDQSGCEALTGMVFDKIIQTRFDISPSFGEITDGKIVIELLPSYHIIIGGKEIITSSMKKLKIQVAQPESIGFSALAELIIKTVTDNAGSIAGQILADTQGLTKIFAAIGVIKGTQKLFDVLVCRGARETIQGMTDLNQAETCAGIAEKTAAEGSYENAALAEAAQAAAGAGGSAAGAESSFNAAAAFFSGLMAEFIFTDTGGGNVQDAREHEKEAEKRKTEAKEAEERARQAVRSMLLIKNLTAEEMADRLVIRWDKIPSEGVVLTYHIRVVRNDRVMIEEDTESVMREIELQSEESENFEICVYAEMVYPELQGDYKYTGDVSGISCVTNSALQLDVDKLPEASAGEAYDFQICVSGGIQPLQFSVHGLPAGLILNEDHITGVPKIGGGEVLVDIMVQDGRGRSVKKSFWMKVK